MPGWNPSKLGESVLIIAIAFILGNLVDQIFSRIFKKHHKWLIVRIIAQILVIIGVVAFFETVDMKLIPKNITSNIFFITFFVGTQQRLLDTMAEIKLIPKLPPAGT